MLKRIIVLGVMVIMVFSLAACTEDYDKKPAGLDDPMPEIWENGFSYASSGQNSGNVNPLSIGINMEGIAEVIIGMNEAYWHAEWWHNTENLENIFVEEGHPKFISENGVLYSKSGETLIRWPAKKPVTKPKDTIKYFAPQCYAQCTMPEDFELPDGTISIGRSAFWESTLNKIHVKQNVKTVGYGAFIAETLKTIEVSSPVTYRTFFNSRYVETIVFNDGVKQIRASDNHRRRIDIMLCLKNVEFPETLEAIGDVYFPVNIAVKKYSLNDNVQYLSELTFDTNAQFGADWYRNSYERARKGKTEFEYSNEVVKKYLNSRISIWEQEWSAFLDAIEISIQNYKMQDSPYLDLEEYLESLQSK